MDASFQKHFERAKRLALESLESLVGFLDTVDWKVEMDFYETVNDLSKRIDGLQYDPTSIKVIDSHTGDALSEDEIAVRSDLDFCYVDARIESMMDGAFKYPKGKYYRVYSLWCTREIESLQEKAEGLRDKYLFGKDSDVLKRLRSRWVDPDHEQEGGP